MIGGIGIGIDQVQRFALLVDELRHGAGGGGHRGLVLGVGDIEAPFAGLRLLVPQIALRARHAGIALGAAPAGSEPGRLGAHSRHRRPDESIGAAAEARQVVLAEPGLGEFDARFERLGVHGFRMREIAQGEFVGIVEVDAEVSRGLDQQAAGPRISDVENEIDFDRAAAGPFRVAHQLDGGEVRRGGQQSEEGEVARGGFLRLLLDVGFDLLDGRPWMQLAEQFLEPLIHPALAQQPVVGPLLRRQREQRPRGHVLGRRGKIGASFGLGDQAGIEGEHGAIAIALFVAVARAVAALQVDHAHARPIGRTFAELAVRAHLQEGDGNPLVKKRCQGILGGNHEVGLGGTTPTRFDHFVLAAAFVELELYQVVHGGAGRGIMEAPFAHLEARGIESEVEELNARAGDQGRRAGIARQAGEVAHVMLLWLSVQSRDSAADLHLIAARVAGLAALALGHAVGVHFAIDRVAGVGLAVGALGICLLLDHQLAVVPACFSRRLAGGAVLLHEVHFALAFVVQRVARPQVILAARRGEAGT